MIRSLAASICALVLVAGSGAAPSFLLASPGEAGAPQAGLPAPGPAGAAGTGDTLGAGADASPSRPPGFTAEAAGAATTDPAVATTLRLTLAEAIEMARASSPLLDSLRSLEAASAAVVDEARAGRMPLAEASASYTRLSEVPELTLSVPGQPTRTIFPNIQDNWAARLGVTLPLYTGGRVGALIEAAERERSASAEEVSTGQGDLTLQTTVTYWDLLTARASARVLEEALRSFEAHVRDAENRQHHGLAAANEVLAIMVERDQAELARLLADNAAASIEADLVRLIGAAPGTRIEQAESLEGADAPSRTAPEPSGRTEAIVEEALLTRSERRSLAARAEAARARSRAERADRLPQLSFNAGYDYANPNRRIAPWTDEWEDTWDASVTVGYRLFDGGRASSAEARELAVALSLEQKLADLDRRIRLDVTQRLLDLGTARASVDVAERNLASARESERVAAERYRAGVIPSSELLDAETALLQAGLQRTSALAHVLIASARLDRAVGR